MLGNYSFSPSPAWPVAGHKRGPHLWGRVIGQFSACQLHFLPSALYKHKEVQANERHTNIVTWIYFKTITKSKSFAKCNKYEQTTAQMNMQSSCPTCWRRWMLQLHLPPLHSEGWKLITHKRRKPHIWGRPWISSRLPHRPAAERCGTFVLQRCLGCEGGEPLFSKPRFAPLYSKEPVLAVAPNCGLILRSACL